MIRWLAVLALGCFVTGCGTSGLSRHERAGAGYPNYILDLQSDSHLNAAREPAVPLHLAVAQVGELAPPTKMLGRFEAAHRVVASVTGLPLPGEMPDNGPASQDGARKNSFSTHVQSLRHLARATGADYVFLFGGNVDWWQQGSALSVLDLTIVGGIIVPSTRIKLEGKAAGALINVATGEPVLFVNVDRRRSAASPTFLSEGKVNSLNAALRDDLTAALSDELLRKLATLDHQEPGAGK
jgi:hypothetical protein